MGALSYLSGFDWGNLPEDMKVEILFRLPDKPLTRLNDSPCSFKIIRRPALVSPSSGPLKLDVFSYNRPTSIKVYGFDPKTGEIFVGTPSLVQSYDPETKKLRRRVELPCTDMIVGGQYSMFPYSRCTVISTGLSLHPLNLIWDSQHVAFDGGLHSDIFVQHKIGEYVFYCLINYLAIAQ
ncbi:hypothetical protein BUALT_Bualt05G0054400 [Buddleja alternifolia]|uniref:Uncharacterized protein n=1 Tax=Buddleja alternifolia TaxID=168488 RepID=A0AAV6XSY6_9LAMI|nr:hypothetical protein BUALT_Bualt05G0054400 [Buddleja alternifolia]